MPPVIPSKVNLQDKTSTVFIQDIYEGEGLKNIPRGVVKKLRIFTYEYAYLNSPSDFDAQGIQSGWDIKRELGEVDVEADGSVMFKVPANTPISIQPLDEKGAAVQWMRSWFTAMPGELVSCVGCHEDQNSIPMPKRVAASQKSPKELTKPKGGIRPFTFTYEIQPILDKYCISCHDNNSKLTLTDSKEELYKRGVVTKIERYYKKSYLNLHPYVYRQGPEADIHVLRPYEYHASNSELVRLLAADHHGVRLSSEDWETLYKWIDFNAPYSGSFEIRDPYKGFEQYSRRRELYKKFGGPDVDWQKEIADYAQYLKSSSVSKQAVIKPISLSDIKNNKTFRSFDSITAKKMQEKKKDGFKRSVSINDTLAITFVWIPDAESKSGKGFWMSETEITNEQFTAFFSQHDSRYIGPQWKDHTTPGYPANHPKQPVVRVSWNEAISFCDSASRKSGFSITLPTAEEWEWACRAGSSEDMWYGSYSERFFFGGFRIGECRGGALFSKSLGLV